MTSSSPPGMRVVPAQEVAAHLGYARLVAALRAAFATGVEMPERHHHTISAPGQPNATLLLMPAWQTGGLLGVKIVSVFPGNAVRRLPALSSSYLLCDAATGTHLALLDGNEITGRRTAATSALGADFLARPEASSLLMVGAGRIAREIPHAMHAVRPIRTVAVWNVNPASAVAFADQLNGAGFAATVAPDLEAAVRQADIVSCATLATAPLIQGDWLQPGVHLDLVGSFTPEMREADDAAFARAHVFIDAPAALHEAGDLLHPLRTGALSPEQCVDLPALCCGDHPGRRAADDITLFKAVGTALADLTAAGLVYHDIGGVHGDAA